MPRCDFLLVLSSWSLKELLNLWVSTILENFCPLCLRFALAHSLSSHSGSPIILFLEIFLPLCLFCCIVFL